MTSLKRGYFCQVERSRSLTIGVIIILFIKLPKIVEDIDFYMFSVLILN